MPNANTKVLDYLDTLGITRWVPRSTPMLQARSITNSSAAAPVLPPGERGTAWEALSARAAACVACELHRSRRHVVFGTGSLSAKWMIVGEAPGAEEDRRGEPFVGRAGKLLNEMLRAVGVTREDAYIANVLKCRPPNNRDPLPEEVERCEPFLREQVRLLKPRIILAVGRIAAQNLLKTDERLGAMRGRRHKYGDQNIPLVVTYHPAYLLRSPKDKRKAWEDLQLAAGLVAAARVEG